MAKRITTNLLVEVGACSEQRELFAELFPDGTEVTEELCIRYAKQFDFYWAAKHLLPMQAWQEYLHTQDEAWEEYYHIRDNAWAEYERIRRAALAKWQRIRNSGRIDEESWAEYERARDNAWAEYKRILGEALAAYQRVCATEFARLWLEYMPD